MIALTKELQQLSDQFDKKTSEALELRQKADLMERRLAAASKLIEGLRSERTRWAADLVVIVPTSRSLCSFCNPFPPCMSPALLSLSVHWQA